MPRFFPRLTASVLQATTYLLGIALFSIAFLVFLNSSISFVITDVIGRDSDDIGDATGTLGFADELLALVACPLWGLISDRIGVRTVAVIGYCIVGLSLFGLVQSKNLYPELLVARLAFSVGGAACSTMVTAVLPSMVTEISRKDEEPSIQERGAANRRAARLVAEDREGRRGSLGNHGATPSMSSEVTITPGRYDSRSRTREQRHRQEPQRQGSDDAAVKHVADDRSAGTSQLAGFVGLFTGAGALLALALFLPMPAYFQEKGQTQAESLETSYYIVAAIAFCVAVFIFIGLRNLPGEEGKTFSALFERPYDENTISDPDGNLHTTLTPAPSYFELIKDSLKLGLIDSSIFLGYTGGFVARASSVAISLFIPVFVNEYFKRTGLCNSDSHNLPDIKENCARAYRLAAALSGIAETAALVCAPLFGWVGGKAAKGTSEWPLLVAAAVGVAGYVAFGRIENPDVFKGKGSKWAFLAVVLIGISQIGAIVCSLGLLGRGINNADANAYGASSSIATSRQDIGATTEGAETAPLLAQLKGRDSKGRMVQRSRLKGSIAGIYSFAGGAGILLLTKLGGSLFDTWTPGAPFYIMAVFNGLLFVAVAGIAVARGMRRSLAAS